MKHIELKFSCPSSEISILPNSHYRARENDYWFKSKTKSVRTKLRADMGP